MAERARIQAQTRQASGLLSSNNSRPCQIPPSHPSCPPSRSLPTSGNRAMARTWAFVGGLLIASTITYMNMSTIQLVTNDFQRKLLRQRKKLEAARNANNPNPSSATEPKKGFGGFVPSADTIVTRIKKTWNEDIERTVRKVQETNWERVVSVNTERFNRLRRRITESGVDSKEKKSS